MQLAALGAVAFIDEDKHLADGRAGLAFQILQERFEVVDIAPAELVNKRAEQARPGLGELSHQLPATFTSLDRLARAEEDALDLLIQLVPVRDDRDTGLRIVLQNPLGEENHHQALPRALRMPDDAALVGGDVLLSSLDPEILMSPRQLLDATVEEDEVVHQLE